MHSSSPQAVKSSSKPSISRRDKNIRFKSNHWSTPLVCSAALLLTACASQQDETESRANVVDPAVLSEPAISIDYVEGDTLYEDVAKDQVSELVQSDSMLQKDAGSARVKTAVSPSPQLSIQIESAGASSKLKRQAPVQFFAGQSQTTIASPHWPTIQPVDLYQPQLEDRENYAPLEHSAIHSVLENPVSTFSIDVDTGSYTNVRRMLNQGYLPRPEAVRVEEFINYFDYDYPVTSSLEQPFSVSTELAQAPWSDSNANDKPQHALLKIGLKAFEPELSERPPANLVFLVDVSGSMSDQNKLPLLKQSLLLLAKQLTEKDRVSIVVYAGASGVVLENAAGNDSYAISQAMNSLHARGSTNGHAGIELAYQLANKWQIDGGINRVMLATDGDFNVGISDIEKLKGLIAKKREQGVSLSTLGLGAGNYNDHLMEQLADVGNGNYAYIDTLKEAQKALVQSLASTIMTVAKDVKIQIEFNPEHVEEYRLIGYENRALKREDFNNDKVDAGEIGAGHTVTAIYELALTGTGASRIDALRYQSEQQPRTSQATGSKELAAELAFLKVRYKQPEGSVSRLMTFPVTAPAKIKALSDSSKDFQFSASVAYFGEVLRNSPYLANTPLASTKNLSDSKFGNATQDAQKRVDNSSFQTIINLANQSKGDDLFGYRSEFIQLVRMAESLSPAT